MDTTTRNALRAFNREETPENAMRLAKAIARGSTDDAPSLPYFYPVELEHRGANCAVLTIPGEGHILFSYGVPVAAVIDGRWMWSSAAAYSNTSVRHVNAWMREHGVERRDADDVTSQEISDLARLTTSVPANGPLAYQHLRASNDSNGNPRRLWIVYGRDGAPLRIEDEGYSGREAVRGLNCPELPSAEITPKDYRAWLRLARERAAR